MSDLEQRVAELEERVSTLESLLAGEENLEVDSVKEFVNKIDPDNHDKTFLAIGYYFENKEGKKKFTNKEIKEGYKRAKRKPYSNFSVLTGRLEDNGLIMEMESEGGKAWALTNKGEEKINSRIEDE